MSKAKQRTVQTATRPDPYTGITGRVGLQKPCTRSPLVVVLYLILNKIAADIHKDAYGWPMEAKIQK